MKLQSLAVALAVAACGLAMSASALERVEIKGEVVQPAPGVGEKKPEAPKVTLEGKLVIKNNKDATYTIEPGKGGEEFEKKLKEGGVLAAPPAPPKVDMEFVITNTGKAMITIPLGSDSSQLNLKLEGPGAVSVEYMQMHTMEMRLGNPTKIEPGKSISLPIKQLSYGNRGDSMAAYWTKAGEYKLTASYTTPLGSGGLDAGEEPEQQITITAEPVKITVKDAEKK